MEAKAHQLELAPQAQPRESVALYFEDADGDPLSWAASSERVHADVRFLARKPRQTPWSTGLIEDSGVAFDGTEDADFGASCRPTIASSSKFQRNSYVDLTVVSGYFNLIFLITAAALVGVGIAVFRAW